MEDNVSDFLHSEEQLKTTLHCDDKEKLRRKLEQLQREYLKTAQRLKRAERLDAVRRHVKSRISLHKHQEQREPVVTSNSLISPSSFILNKASIPDSQQYQADAVDSDASRRKPVIQFSLPGDSAYPQTPDPSNDIARSHRPSPALRLRSKRSRLRWERRSADALDSRQEQAEGIENTEIKENVVNESEEQFSESPSLLLTHWSTQESTESGDKMVKENQRPQDDRGEETDQDVHLKFGKPALTTDEGQDVRENSLMDSELREDGIRQSKESDPVGCEEKKQENTKQNAAQVTGIEKQEEIVENKVEKNQTTANEKAASLLDSCTLVEGLLFPVEYYIRTTRRMALSQSQPDVQAVIQSRLSAGRHRRSRGRSRGTHRDSQQRDRNTQTDSSSSTTPSTSLEPLKPSTANPCEDCSQSSIDTSSSDIPEGPFPPPVPSLRPPRGRRKGRGRGRGRSLRPPGCKQTPITAIPSTQSIHQADETHASATPLPEDQETSGPQQSSTHSFPAQPAVVSGAPTNNAANAQEKVYPIFLKCSTSRSQQMNTGTSDWASLLLPPVSSLPQTPPPSLPSLIRSLKNLDILQDFHLPDDQFASLKLHKLRQVAMESGHEQFSTPSHNTRRRSNCLYSAICPPTPCRLPLSLTPLISNWPCPNESEQTECKLTDNLSNKSVTEELCDPDVSGTNMKLDVDKLKDSSKAILEVQGITGSCELEERDTGTQSCTFSSRTANSINCVDLEAHQDVVGRSVCKENAHSDESKVEQPAGKHIRLHDPIPTDPQFEDCSVAEQRSFCFSESKTAEEAPTTFTDSPVCSKATAKLPVNGLNLQYSSGDYEEPKTNLSKDTKMKNTDSQFVFKSPLESVVSSFTPPYIPSSTPASIPVLPSLGITPNPAQLTSSPSAPALYPPPPHSPSTQELSPPDLSPISFITSLPPSVPSPALSDQDKRGEPAACPTASSIQLQSSAVEKGMTKEETADKWLLRCTHTLEAPAGGSLVDACCVSGQGGALSVAAAGKWAVCLWSQTSESDWSLRHTWTFSEPVINIFPVPDSEGLMFVSLGQLEIRELRMLSCFSLRQMLICEGIIHAVVGLFNSRVVTSSDSTVGSTLQVFTLSDSSRLSSQPLVSPGVCVSALAPVEGLPDALIGTDEGGHLFIWNLKTGQLLSRVLLEHSLSNTACLRGYSHCGLLLVLLQHQFLRSLDLENKEKQEKNEILSEGKLKPALFSLVGINPLSGKSVLVTAVRPPKSWTGRICEVDINRSSIVGLSQSGRVCVWELGDGGTPRTMEAPEDEDWQLARWGEEDSLVIGHQNGDVSLHSYSSVKQIHHTKKD
ncbi:PREDICTED: partner and localizer of BRCA2 isoform X3 [Cyprinodon variegatus]|uniref:partner and localizer of BRCA2 isoform X3 n=1 Tax=Cyprinodon variegatus TaxID=28743 RepID=UPI000742B6F1|nr:PREDICTED: partner and localizer of BRCA2 isoform X3 [Cyprinodon variegatus]